MIGQDVKNCIRLHIKRDIFKGENHRLSKSGSTVFWNCIYLSSNAQSKVNIAVQYFFYLKIKIVTEYWIRNSNCFEMLTIFSYGKTVMLE